MTECSVESGARAGAPGRAPPIGRALRVVLGILLLIYVVPPYFHFGLPFAVRAVLSVLGIACVYSLIHVALSRWRVERISATVLVFGLLGVLFFWAGARGGPIFGEGEGQLAAATFLGVSLVLAGLRAVSGCELMAVPEVIFHKHAEVYCPVFSPIDTLERSLRRRRGKRAARSP